MPDIKKHNATKIKIMNAAILLFAGKGFASTTTREICKNAEANLSMISYYFKTKDGLYTSIIESIMDYGIEYLSDKINLAEKINDFKVEEKIQLYKSLLEKFAEFLYSERVPNSFVILMIKEQTTAHSKFSEMYARKINILYSALRKILASIKNKRANDKNIIFEVSTIIGQILSYKIMDRATLSALNQSDYTKDDKNRITKIIYSHIDNYIKTLNV